MGRVAGPFGSPIILGVCVSFISLYLYNGYKLGIMPGVVYALTVLVAAALCIATFTRSVWLGIIVSSVYLVFKASGRPVSRTLALLGLGVVVLVLGGYLISQEAIAERIYADTGSARMGVAYGSLRLIAENPLFGSGFGSFDELIPKYLPNYLLGARIHVATSHVTLLTLLAELGIIGTIWLLAFLAAALLGSRRQLSPVSGGGRLLMTVNYGFLLAFAVNAFLIDMRFFSLAYCWLFISLGMLRNAYTTDSSGPE
jgi:O-antigen ligase